MDITIITATYNAEKHLKKLLKSISIQKSKKIEFIIIDGGSSDNTLKIINENKKIVSLCVSEPDNGIYDAWNKGLKLATGDWIMYLGADDILMPNAITSYLDFIYKNKHLNLDYISSKVQIVNNNGNPVWINGKKWKWPLFKYKMTVAHPGSLHSKNLYLMYGNYNIEYKIVGDYEYLLRPGNKLKADFMDIITVNMTEGGISDSWKAMREYINATIKTGKASRMIIYFIAFYVFCKSKLNKIVRIVGLNFNIDS